MPKSSEDSVQYVNELLDRGTSLFLEKKFSEALECYRRVLQIHNSCEAMIKIADCYLALGDRKEAESAFRDFLDCDCLGWEENYDYEVDNILRAYETLADLFYEEGKYEDALKQLNKALRFYIRSGRKNNPQEKAILHFMKAECNYKLLNYGEAKRQCNLALKFLPSYKNAHVLMTKISLEIKDYVSAERHLKDAVETTDPMQKSLDDY